MSATETIIKTAGIFISVLLLCGFSSAKIDNVIAEGNIIVNAFHSYYQKHREYPKIIEDILPHVEENSVTILRDFPDIKHEAFIKVNAYKFFVRILVDTDELTRCDEYRYGFEINYYPLSSFITKQRLIYTPSEIYPDRRFEVVKKVYKGWAQVRRYRQYGEENTVVYNNPERRVNVREPIHDPFSKEYYNTRVKQSKQNIRDAVEAAREGQPAM